MSRRVTIDFFTIDSGHDEYVMYLVEEGPWSHEDLPKRLSKLRERIYDAVDVAIDGYLAQEHPESSGMNVRVQVDLHDNAPVEAEELVVKLAQHLAIDPEYSADIAKSRYVRGVRLVVKRPGEGRSA